MKNQLKLCMKKPDGKNKESKSLVSDPYDFSLRQYERIETIQRKIEVKDLLSEVKEHPKHIYIEGIAVPVKAP